MEIQEKRKMELFQFMDCSLGTLWWVKDILWQQNPKFVPNKDREEHPGVSILRHQKNQYRTEVPMLFGTSHKDKWKKLIVVKGISADDGQEKEKKRKTYFGCLLKPCHFNFLDFFSGDIERNEHKRRLDDEETAKLNKFLREKLK